MSNAKKKTKVGKLKLNGDFLKKLESSIGCKAVSSSSNSSSTTKTNKTSTIITDTTPFIPPLPPNLIKKKIEKEPLQQEKNTMQQNKEENNITKNFENENNKTQPSSIVINNNISYPIHENKLNQNPSNFLNDNYNNFFNNNYNFILQLLKEQYNSMSLTKQENNETNFLKQRIELKTLLVYILAFTSGYLFGRYGNY